MLTALPPPPRFDMIWNTYIRRSRVHIHVRGRTYAHIDNRRFPRLARVFADTHTLRSATKQSANHSTQRAYSDACHNERRATFCFGPVGRKYRPFWIFNFQRSSKPLRAPPPSAFPPVCLFLPRSRRHARLSAAVAACRIYIYTSCTNKESVG